MFKLLFRAIKTAIILVVMAVVLANVIVIANAVGKIYTIDELEAQGQSYDCIVVLGASVLPDQTLSDILEDRVVYGIKAYEAGLAPCIVMSGDGREQNYNEPRAMKNYALEQGIPSQVVYRDGAGYKTYDSMWRISEVFGASRVIVVTQRYHLPRALFTLKMMGVDAVGIASNEGTYDSLFAYNLREIPGRVKDLVLAMTNQLPENPTEEILL